MMTDINNRIVNLTASAILTQFYQPDSFPEYFSEYKQLSCLKHSSEHSVYLVEKNSYKYILKMSAGDLRDVLEKEYELLKTLDFSFLPEVLDFHKTDGENWLLREYIEGRTLYDIAETRGLFKESEAVGSTLAVIDLINEMHSLNPPVIHRDIKPQNIVLTPDGQYKIIDIGTARNYDKEKSEDTVYSGTAATAAPEHSATRRQTSGLIFTRWEC